MTKYYANEINDALDDHFDLGPTYKELSQSIAGLILNRITIIVHLIGKIDLLNKQPRMLQIVIINPQQCIMIICRRFQIKTILLLH